MCLKHWRMVPLALQRAVWANYRKGQEIDKQPSAEYIAAAQAAINAVATKEGESIKLGDVLYVTMDGRQYMNVKIDTIRGGSVSGEVTWATIIANRYTCQKADLVFENGRWSCHHSSKTKEPK